jgi:predicted component of type VI protein secretion system
MAQFRFVMRSGPAVGRAFPLEGNEISIGRDTSNKISINDAEISRKHARLLWRDEGYVLEDFGSTNGSFVNGQRLSGSIPLKVGDLVALGENVVLMVEADYDPDATRLSSKAKVVKAAPAPAPAPAPVPAYAGQVPAEPVPMSIPVAAKKSRKIIWIVVAAVVLLCICGVSVYLFFAPCEFWLNIPFIQWAPCP